jgi:tyrosine decarboxylase/aspartate 1-decarboxylase
MLREGLKKREILDIIKQKTEQDLSYDSGFILGSMCSEPLEFGKQVYMKYLSKNLGDPGLFPGTACLENELIKEIGALFSGNNITGTITTGGTEANIIALYLARKSRPDIKNPEFIIPSTAHFSFEKAKEIMGGSIRLRKLKIKEDYQLDLTDFETSINKKTCGVLGIAGTTSLGLIDPIEEMGKIIEDKNIFFHVDAAFGGFCLPFLKEIGYKVPLWDFQIDEVDSITADPHKMGLGVIPTGGLFIRDRSIMQKTGYNVPYLAGGDFKHINITGTRPGGQVIAFWAILKFLGMEGFKKVVKSCMENTFYLSKLISEIKGVKLAVQPQMNIVGITTENGNSIAKIDKDLRRRGWMLGKFPALNIIRVVVMPHIQKKHLSHFSDDLAKIVK